MSHAESEIEAGAAVLFAFPYANAMQAWSYLSDEYKPPYRERVRQILAAAKGAKQ